MLSHAAPLLEEEAYARLLTLVADGTHPIGLDRARTRTALTTDDDPVNALEIEGRQGAEQWLEAEEPDRGVHAA
jgi:hypothetical protein